MAALASKQVCDGKGLQIGLVASRYNGAIVENLVHGAREALRECGVADENVPLVWVPGSFELPLAAKKMTESGAYHAIVCIGCVIRGGTSHYDLVCAEAARGISNVSLVTGVPAIFAVVTADSMEQAEERSGAKMDNKGYEGGLAAVEMAALVRSLEGPGSEGRNKGKRA